MRRSEANNESLITDRESLLSKLAVRTMNEEGVEHAAYDGGEVAKRHHITAEVNPYAAILQHLQSVTPALSSRRVSEGGGRDQGRTTRARLHLLGAVCRDAVLPAGARAFLARDLRRVGELRRQARASGSRRAQAVVAGLRERASAVAAVPSGVLPPARALSGRRGVEEISV